jgi:uncharacterized protein YecA (UPF0149 family)
MGAIAEAIATYAQPLLEATDGSEAALNRALSVAQLCWNLAIMPENEREKAIDEMKPALKMTDEEFAIFRRDVILAMIRRHHEMFPGFGGLFKHKSDIFDVAPPPTKKHPGTDRYAPCPCGSGRKYKFCCGAPK